VLASSNGGSLTNFSGGTQDVFCTAPAKYLDTFSSTNQGVVPASGGGTANFLRADGSFAAPPATAPAGSTTQIQYNNAGAFGADANFTFTSGTNTLTTGNITGSGTTSMVIQSKAPALGSSPTLTIQTPNSPSTSYTPANLILKAGSRFGSGVQKGGDVNINAGNGGALNGGDVNITAGSGDPFGGSINLTPGAFFSVNVNGDFNAASGSASVYVFADDGSTGASAIGMSSNNLGFYGTFPISKPDVNGSRATGAALVSLLSALASLGLITDSTTV
jgi:hypothetical protein